MATGKTRQQEVSRNDWLQSLHQITQLKVEMRFPTGLRLINPAMQDYFTALQKLIVGSAAYDGFLASGVRNSGYTTARLNKLQSQFYWDITPEGDHFNYSQSFGNPYFACYNFGLEIGRLLCYAYSRFRGSLMLLIQQRYDELVKLHRLFWDLHKLGLQHTETGSDPAPWQAVIRRFVSSDLLKNQQFNLFWRYDPQQTYYRDIILRADLSDLSYLYRYGIYVTDNIRKLARFMSAYPEKELKQLSRYIVKSYEDGFERGNRSYKIKKNAILIIPAGLERLGRMLIKDLQKIGLEPVVAQPQAQAANRQYEYDHRHSMSVFYDEEYAALMLPRYEQACKAYSKVLKSHAGPVYVELFGETPFIPESNEIGFRLSDAQRSLLQKTSSQTTRIFYSHYKQEESSFCIIAFPSPEIGPRFKAIFADTVKINLLDSLHYAALQQKIIDVLDTAEFVHVKGKDANKTDIMVRLHPLKDPARETNFENCVADVNIPVGEVFTSPLLKGTSGVLHVKDIYLRNLRFRNLTLTFKDGMITDYTCSNYKTPEDNRKYVEDNLLLPHKTLPIGEFAIGTNTLAYKTAIQYDILGLLPILIIEKMGPHFAVGDTCYTREEDVDHFNFFNGKKLIAVDNEKTALRHKDPMQAYTQTHTDITLPYEMLKSITAIRKDGSQAYIIRDGLFAVPGTEELNQPLLEVINLLNRRKQQKKTSPRSY
jgi:leucyl aminopeptidase (aminopeptidase T)